MSVRIISARLIGVLVVASLGITAGVSAQVSRPATEPHEHGASAPRRMGPPHPHSTMAPPHLRRSNAPATSRWRAKAREHPGGPISGQCMPFTGSVERGG
jgi:hypothetical protein